MKGGSPTAGFGFQHGLGRLGVEANAIVSMPTPKPRILLGGHPFLLQLVAGGFSWSWWGRGTRLLASFLFVLEGQVMFVA